MSDRVFSGKLPNKFQGNSNVVDHPFHFPSKGDATEPTKTVPGGAGRQAVKGPAQIRKQADLEVKGE